MLTETVQQSLAHDLLNMRSLLLAALLTFAPAAFAAAPAPEFTHRAAEEWLNSPPLTLKELRGKVLLIDFWTFDCWNCYRSFPWLHTVEERYGKRGFQVIGVHTPEFAHEKVRANIERKVKEFKLTHPIMIDNDFSYWNAMKNSVWPAFFILDKQGRIRKVVIGETHVGDSRAKIVEAEIEKLLTEAE
ncbi:MAG: redoxin family protein [Burkholderiales bacterium]